MWAPPIFMQTFPPGNVLNGVRNKKIQIDEVINKRIMKQSAFFSTPAIEIPMYGQIPS